MNVGRIICEQDNRREVSFLSRPPLLPADAGTKACRGRLRAVLQRNAVQVAGRFMLLEVFDIILLAGMLAAIFASGMTATNHYYIVLLTKHMKVSRGTFV